MEKCETAVAGELDADAGEEERTEKRETAVTGEADGDDSGVSEEVGEEGGVAKGVASGVTEKEAEDDEAEVRETGTEKDAVNGITVSTAEL